MVEAIVGNINHLSINAILGVCRTIDIFSQIKAFLGNQAQPYS